MAEDVLMHLASNSSNQSDQSSKIAKLEARMLGKATSTPSLPQQLSQSTWPSTSPAKFAAPVNVSETLESSDSDDDEDGNGEEYLIQANTGKRQKLREEYNTPAVESHEKTQIAVEEKVKCGEPEKVVSDGKKRKGRGRGNSVSSRGRASRVNGATKSQLACSPMNGHLDKANHVDNRSKDYSFSNEQANDECIILKAKVGALENELLKSREENSELRSRYSVLEMELREVKEREQEVKTKISKVISDMLIAFSKAERQEARMKVRQDSLRLGNVGVIRTGTLISEGWEDGQLLKDLNAHLKQLLETKETVERQRKTLKKKPSEKNEIDSDTGVLEDDNFIQDEILKARLASIKREEETILRERERYELEKGRLIREMKRIRDEDGSRFNNFQILNHRYALLNLLGKGGFSEVYKAYDLVDHRYVACKLHSLNAHWSEEKKQNYVRHALREYNIHKTLIHNNIVRLWDTFEIDQSTFCTILEYCCGKDLDAVLKATPILPEKEARIIIFQIFQGLIYLNKRSMKIIHYDLKPGNVLFDDLGVAKVTDFGLSKIVEDNAGSQGMELTSQGAGTYWYLPPECFDLAKTPLISSKVDVWSAGVLLYQMLFGRRPFGHDQTQERILREDTIIKARKVDFPTKPSVSNEAKEFIRKCLTYHQADRPDVLSIAQDPYLSYCKK